MSDILFKPFPKIPRLSRECIITEKIDGTNGCIYNGEDGEFLVGSRNRWITPENDNHGFARWAYEHKEELQQLGPGCHYGEWWGHGIQRGYGLKEKRFSLFNTHRWEIERPTCCHVVPIMFKGTFSTIQAEIELEFLQENGSLAALGFMQPEGIVIYHVAGNLLFKKTIHGDDKPKGEIL